MGYVRHDSIIVTTWNPEGIERALAIARQAGLNVLGPSRPTINGYQTLCVVPDGSKEGWIDSDVGDSRRRDFLAWLEGQGYDDGSSCFEWCAVSYGSDDACANITASAWGGKESDEASSA